jgi:hypothetical protein
MPGLQFWFGGGDSGMSRSHEFQLVYQLPENCPLESLYFEDDIAEALDNSRDDKDKPHVVDGNSCGAGSIEFFVDTNDPQGALELTKPLLESAGLLNMVVVAYRRFSEDTFKVIWPMKYSGVFKP